MQFFINFLKGILIGIGAVAPGVSGGSLAVILGIYEKITDFISNFFGSFRKNFMFFLPIGLGGIVGVLGFSKIIEYLFKNYNLQVKYLFIGLIAGTLPSVFNQANKKGFKKIYILPFILSLIFTMSFSILDNLAQNSFMQASPSFLSLIGYGTILGFGTIIPGISASIILIFLGAYETIISSISNINIAILIPVGIGFVLSIILFAKLINFLFKKAYGYTYYAILGFVIGSLSQIFPGFKFNFEHLISLLILVIGLFLTYFLCGIRVNREDN